METPTLLGTPARWQIHCESSTNPYDARGASNLGAAAFRVVHECPDAHKTPLIPVTQIAFRIFSSYCTETVSYADLESR